MPLTVEVNPDIQPNLQDLSFTIIIYSEKIRLTFWTLPMQKDNRLTIDFWKISGLDKCLFIMGTENIDEYLLKNAHKTIEERFSGNVINRGTESFTLKFPNAEVLISYSEALDFYQIVDRLDDEIKKLSSTVSLS